MWQFHVKQQFIYLKLESLLRCCRIRARISRKKLICNSCWTNVNKCFVFNWKVSIIICFDLLYWDELINPRKVSGFYLGLQSWWNFSQTSYLLKVIIWMMILKTILVLQSFYLKSQNLHYHANKKNEKTIIILVLFNLIQFVIFRIMHFATVFLRMEMTHFRNNC